MGFPWIFGRYLLRIITCQPLFWLTQIYFEKLSTFTVLEISKKVPWETQVSVTDHHLSASILVDTYLGVNLVCICVCISVATSKTRAN